MQVIEELSKIKSAKKRDAQEAEIRTRITAEYEDARKSVIEAGGLFIICTERHESRRIDNQLRGRSGRQGDPGASKFFLSLEDDLMRIFGSERIDTMLQKLGLEKGEAIVHPWINKALEKAQKKVEERNFEIRKNLLQFDDVMNDQRKVIYEQRRELMEVDDVSATVSDMRLEVIDDIVSKCIPEKAYAEQWETETLHEEVLRITGLDLPVSEWSKQEGIADEEIRAKITTAVNHQIAEKVANYGPDMMRIAEKSVLLQVLDQIWKEHLLALDHLRQGIGLRAYAQKDPLNEYKHDAFDLFDQMLAMLRETVTQVLCHMEISDENPEELLDYNYDQLEESRNDSGMAAITDNIHPAAETQNIPLGNPKVIPANTKPEDVPPGWRLHEPIGRWVDPEDPETWGKVPRNAACPCGSGKKYKVCHGRVV